MSFTSDDKTQEMRVLDPTQELRPDPYDEMINHILPILVERLRHKSADYGDVFKELGIKGQYSDMHRKMRKLKKALWDGEPLQGEQSDEILADLFGNILIALYLLDSDYLKEGRLRASE